MPSEAISWGEKGFSPNVVMGVMGQEDREIFYLFTHQLKYNIRSARIISVLGVVKNEVIKVLV
jgi:hypothetical protein